MPYRVYLRNPMDPPDITGDVEPAASVHLPDRNNRRPGSYQSVRKQYNYKQLQNEPGAGEQFSQQPGQCAAV